MLDSYKLQSIFVFFFVFAFTDSPKLLTSPLVYSGNAGISHNFTCSATGHPVPIITWTFSSVRNYHNETLTLDIFSMGIFVLKHLFIYLYKNTSIKEKLKIPVEFSNSLIDNKLTTPGLKRKSLIDS